jgi:hypothetical protein
MKLKKRNLAVSSKIREPKAIEDRIKHPVFCFKYLHRNYHIDACTDDEKICLLNKIVKLSGITWQDIEQTGRHGLGSEKISRDSIGLMLHEDITDDVNFFIAMRFCGKKPFVGFRNKFVFHILFIDRNFSLYEH